MTPPDPVDAGNLHAPHLPPVEVWRACLLILGSLVLSLALLIPGITPVQPGSPGTPLLESLTVLAIFGGLTVWLVLKTLQRRRWARWSLCAYLALTWLLAAQGLADDFAVSPLAGLIDVVSIVMEMFAVWGLLFGPAPKWFEG